MVSVVGVWLECGNSVPSHSQLSSSLLGVSVLHAIVGYIATVAAKSVSRSVSVTELTVR